MPRSPRRSSLHQRVSPPSALGQTLTKLIKKKKVQLVFIAHDVDPIEPSDFSRSWEKYRPETEAARKDLTKATDAKVDKKDEPSPKGRTPSVLDQHSLSWSRRRRHSLLSSLMMLTL